MRGTTHFVLGATVWTVFETIMLPGKTLPYLDDPTLVAAVGALLPDLDNPNSILGSRRVFRVISVPLSIVFEHRGMTHSLFAAGAVGALMMWIGGAVGAWVTPLAMGYLSHLLADVMTVQGCSLFWPIPKKITLGLMETGSVADSAIMVALVIYLLVARGIVGDIFRAIF